jgi:hypothetical protein
LQEIVTAFLTPLHCEKSYASGSNGTDTALQETITPEIILNLSQPVRDLRPPRLNGCPCILIWHLNTTHVPASYPVTAIDL